jgi:Helix-turn-helix domain
VSRESVRAPYAQPLDPAADAGSENGGGQRVPSTSSPYVLVEDVAARLHCSRRTVHELTRTCAIPHRRLPGSRRCLFLIEELRRWEEGATLEIQELARGGRVVRVRN